MKTEEQELHVYAGDVSKLYETCLKEAKEQNESGSNALVGSYGDTAKRFITSLRKQIPTWYKKAVEVAETVEYQRISRGSGQYRQNLYYLSFGETGYYTDPFPARLKRAELLQEAVFCLLRGVTAVKTEGEKG